MPRMTIDARAAARVKRLDSRRRTELPLFAQAGGALLDSVAPLPAVDEVLGDLLHRHQAVRAMLLHNRLYSLHGWLRFRRLAEQYLTMVQIRYMELYCRRTYPTDPGYRVDYWRRMCAWLGIREAST